MAFLEKSPSPPHAVSNLAAMLSEAGFHPLELESVWQLSPNEAAFVTLNDTSLIAFRVGSGTLQEQGIRMMGAPPDSPCLKIKPVPERYQHGCLQLSTEIYGGALLAPWFDRDLSLAGRVTGRLADGTLRSGLVDFVRPVATVLMRSSRASPRRSPMNWSTWKHAGRLRSRRESSMLTCSLITYFSLAITYQD